MSHSEIKAFNEGLERDHPYYIVCRKLEVTGSLVRKNRVCLTNDEWREAVRIGNTAARDWMNQMRDSSSLKTN